MNNSRKIVISAAIAGIFAGGLMLSGAASAKEEMVKCMGANSCKGKSACAGGQKGNNTCKGTGGCGGKQNACKGQGFKEMPKSKCEKMIKKQADECAKPNLSEKKKAKAHCDNMMSIQSLSPSTSAAPVEEAAPGGAEEAPDAASAETPEAAAADAPEAAAAKAPSATLGAENSAAGSAGSDSSVSP